MISVQEIQLANFQHFENRIQCALETDNLEEARSVLTEAANTSMKLADLASLCRDIQTYADAQ